MDEKYEKQLTTSFYVYWYLRKMFPPFIDWFGFCFDGGRNNKYRDPFDQNPTFSEIADHYDEQKKQVDYLLSVKYRAQQVIVGQITDYKTNILSSNKDESASLNLLVEEIWDIYDVDHSGYLDKDELAKFVKEYMPEMLKDYKFSE